MDVAHTYSDTEIENLCKEICSELEETSQHAEKDCFDLLLKVCGQNQCDCGNYTPYQNLGHLIKVLLYSDTFTDYTVGLSVIDNYDTLGDEATIQTVLEKMLKHALSDSPSENRSHFLEQIWSYPGLRNFTTNSLEEYLPLMRKHLEEDLFHIYRKCLQMNVNPERVWKENDCERIVFWSSNSTKIFSLVTSVLNEWLWRIVSSTNQYKSVVNVVHNFVISVKGKCVENKKDFVCLYPLEFHCLIPLLDLNPKSYPPRPVSGASLTLSTVVELVKLNIKSKPIQTLCLLTHFPEWASYINR